MLEVKTLESHLIYCNDLYLMRLSTIAELDILSRDKTNSTLRDLLRLKMITYSDLINLSSRFMASGQ